MKRSSIKPMDTEGTKAHRLSITDKLKDSQNDVELSMVTIMTDQVCPIIRKHLKVPEDQVHQAVKTYRHCQTVLEQLDPNCIGLKRNLWLLKAALRMSVLEWYQETYNHYMMSNAYDKSIKPAQRISLLVEVSFLKGIYDLKESSKRACLL